MRKKGYGAVNVIFFVTIGPCTYLRYPRNGQVSVTTYDAGGVATYTCNHGFRLVGSSPRICLSNETWSGVEPICNGMFNIWLTLMAPF